MRNSQKPTHALPVAIGAAAAGLVGAGLGMLFAPKKGKDLRKDLSATVHDASDTVRETYVDAKRTLVGDYRMLRDDLDRVVRDLGEKGEVTKDAFSDAVDDVVAKASRAKHWTRTEAKKYATQLKREFQGA